MDNLLNVKEASMYLKCSKWTLYRIIKRREISFIRQRRTLLFKSTDLETYVSKDRIDARSNLIKTLNNNLIKAVTNNNFVNEVKELASKSNKSNTRHYGYGSVYQRNKTWTIDFYVNGKRIQKAIAGAQNREEALHILLQERVKSFDKPHEIEELRQENIGFRDFARPYHEVHMKTNRRNFKPDTYRLKTLCAYFKNVDLRTITPLKFERFIASRLKKGNSKSTCNRYLQLAGKMFSLAVEEGYLEENPVRKIKPFSEKDTQKERILTEAEEEKLMENCSPNLKPIITVALNTGMRRAEILGLTWSQIDFEARLIKVEKTKSGKTRHIPINDDLFKQILKLRNENGQSPFVFLNPETKRPFLDMKTPFKRACRISGIEGLRFHDLRHTFATRLVEKRIHIRNIRDLLGHSSVVITERYAHSSVEGMRKAVETLNKKTEKKAEIVTKIVTI